MLSHPVGVRPRAEIAADIPLDNNSRITCLTCHDDSQSSDDLGYPDSSEDRLLRRPAGVQFCSTCHTQMGGTVLEQSHWWFSTRAHLGSKNLQSTPPEELRGDIDAESRICLSCHEDISVVIPPYDETVRQKKLRWKNMSDHPIGMDYGHIALRKPGSYKFPLFDDEGIRLFNGRVGCGSCHSLYSQMRKNLVARYERGILCKKCHNK